MPLARRADSVPDLSSYNLASILEPVYILCHSPVTHRWSQIEQSSVSGVSIINLLFTTYVTEDMLLDPNHPFPPLGIQSLFQLGTFFMTEQPSVPTQISQRLITYRKLIFFNTSKYITKLHLAS